MYEVHDDIGAANDILWAYIKSQLAQQTDKPVPETLFRDLCGNFAGHWQEPDLFLSQTCGYPFIVDLAERGIRIVATPVYEVNKALPAGWYRSVVIVHKDFRIPEGAPRKERLRLLKGLRAGYNGDDSNSGMNLFRAALLEVFSDAELQQGLFSGLQMTGAHKSSVSKVAGREIDVAAIDNVTYHLLGRYYPDLVANTKVLTTTGISPGLPLITAANTTDADIARLREILIGQLAKDTAADSNLKDALNTAGITGFVYIEPHIYEAEIGRFIAAAANRNFAMIDKTTLPDTSAS